MLTRLLIRLGTWAQPRLATPRWSSGVGLARTLLALGTLGTLLVTDPAVLMSPLVNSAPPPRCDGVAAAGIWCLTPDTPQLGRWLSVAVLVVVASGWRPRFTGVPHWYVSWSLMANATMVDGGDQVTTVLTLLLIPVALTDPRRWHWHPTPPGADGAVSRRQVVTVVTVLLIQVQVAAVYMHAAIAKLGVAEWANGTSLFYWLHHPVYGAPPWWGALGDVITHSPYGVAAVTWGTLVLEFALGIALVLSSRAKWLLLGAGLIFHLMIAMAMGLVSFGLAMSGALLLYLLPAGHDLRWPGQLWRWLRSRRSATTSPQPADGPMAVGAGMLPPD